MSIAPPGSPAPAGIRHRITHSADHLVELLTPSKATNKAQSRQVTLIVWAAIVAGVAIRAFRLLQPGGTYRLSIDAPAVYGAAAQWLSVDTLYRDISLMHPPGAAGFYVPFALLGRVAGDRWALLASYAAGAMLAGLAIWLIGYIVRPWGRTAAFVACGLYAAAPIIASVDKHAQLELFLSVGLLAAIALLFRARTAKPIWAGIVLGAATTIKIWGIADIVLLLVVLAVVAGARPTCRFVLGCAIPAAACLPVFLAAPADLMKNVVWAQLSRPVMDGSLTVLSRFSQAFPFRSGGNGGRIVFALPALAIGLVLVAASIAVAVAGIVAMRKRNERKLNRLPALLAFIGLAALLHFIIVMNSPSYYNHYYVFPLVPQILAVAAILAAVVHARAIWRAPVWAAAGTAMALAGMVAAQNAPIYGFAQDAGKVRSIVAKHKCLWGAPPDLAMADAITKNAANDCGAVTDPLGRSIIGAYDQGLTSIPAMQKGSDYRAAMYEWLKRSDAFVVPTMTRIYSLDPSAKAYVKKNFKKAGTYWEEEWWVRK